MFEWKKSAGKIYTLPVESIRPSPFQARTVFDEKELAGLAQSIRENGLLQPISVRKVEGGYELVAGERRLRACQLAKMTTIPAILCSYADDRTAALGLLENIQRADLNPFEQAQGLRDVMVLWDCTQAEAAKRLGMAQPTLANKLRLLRLPEDVRALLRENGLTERHARALLRLQDPEVQRRAAGDMVRRGMNVAQAEAYVEKLLQSAQVTPPRGRSTYIIKDVRLFLNSVDRGLHLMRQAGVDAGWDRQDTDREILLTIRIPKRASGKIDSVSESC